tara:strand:- start:1294 stop:2220 length:927 start_codon:yes stop_codon:yes gene_type:complete
MIINKKRIRSLSSYTKGIPEGQNLIVAVAVADVVKHSPQDVGFSAGLEPGEKVLPAAVGNVTLFNSRGKEVPLKDQPMETHYRQQEWTWKEFRGRYDFEKRSRIVDIPYERYPRKIVPPPSIELSVAVDTEGEKLIVADPIRLIGNNEEIIVHVINVFLEIFGICEIRNEDLDSIIRSPVRRLNWDVLPKGKKPWGEMKSLMQPVIDGQSEGNKVVIEKRFEAINSFEPEFVAVGRAGFSGYIVFGFPESDLYVLESTKTNNATYVIENNWEYLSGLTKAEILERKLHKERVIHRENWFEEIGRVLSD